MALSRHENRGNRICIVKNQVIRVESQVLKIQQEGSPAEGSDSTRRLVGNGSSSSSSAVGAGAPGGGGGGGSSSRPGGVGGGGPSRSLRPAGGDSARGRSGGGGVGNGGSSGSAGGGVGEIVTFEHEEIVEFEPWMADPKIAAVGRLEGVTIEARVKESENERERETTTEERREGNKKRTSETVVGGGEAVGTPILRIDDSSTAVRALEWGGDCLLLGRRGQIDISPRRLIARVVVGSALAIVGGGGMVHVVDRFQRETNKKRIP